MLRQGDGPREAGPKGEPMQEGRKVRIAVRLVLCWLVLALAGAMASAGQLEAVDPSPQGGDALLADVQPVILAGAYIGGNPTDSPNLRIDPNSSDSPFAGVGSIALGGVLRGTAVPISQEYLLTAAHLLDLDNDGIADVTPGDLAFHLNAEGDSSHVLGIASFDLHPDFTGFGHPALNDDIAVLALASPLPAGVPWYQLYRQPLRQGDVVTLVGYGRSGWGDLGFRLPWEDLNTKRRGQNAVDLAFLDDEGLNYAEVFVFDFDGPDDSTNVLGGLTLGNAIETTLGFGDSGGPALIWVDDHYELAGINTYIARFTARPEQPPLFGSAGGGIMVFPLGAWIEEVTGLAWDINILALDALGDPAFMRPGETLTLHLDVRNLAQRVFGVQAFMAFDSGHFSTDPGDVSVAPGGGVWDQLIFSTFNVLGDLDVAIGINLELPSGTDADATTALITLTATTEGTTRVEFRPDAQPDPGLVATTMLSDELGLSVIPRKVDSQEIVIDGTPPVVSNLVASQGGTDVLGCAATAVQGTVNISVEASDALAGLAVEPVVTVTQGPDALAVIFGGENPAGTFNYSLDILPATPNGTWDIHVTATDNAGNFAVITGILCINKYQISGTVSQSTLSGNSYSFGRDVTFTATDGSGAVLAAWTVTVSFMNQPGTGMASGPFTLVDVPTTAVNLSAKSEWTLRSRQPVDFDADGQAPAEFVGSKALRCGDLDGSNSVTILDYSRLKRFWNLLSPEADLNGDGYVNALDYTLMKSNWFQVGDPL